MKIQAMIVLITLLCPINAAASEPFADNDMQRLESPRAIEDGLHGDDAVDDESVFAIPEDHFKYAHPHPHHHIDRPLGIIPIHINSSDAEAGSVGQRSKESNAQGQSMRRFSTIEPSAFFDRLDYLRAHVQGLIVKEKHYGNVKHACRWCNVSWYVLGSASAIAVVLISSLGASQLVDPQLANFLNIVFEVSSGACFWAGKQADKGSHEYHVKQTGIQGSLGIPSSWRDPEVRINIDQFNGRSGGEAPTAAAAAAH